MRAEPGKLALAVLLASCSWAARAQSSAESPPGAPLGLSRAIELAAQNDPGLAAAGALERAAAATVDEARAAAMPKLELGADLARTTDPVRVFGGLLGQESFSAANFELASLNQPDPLTHAVTRLELQVPVYTAGRVGAARAAAGSLLMAASADRERGRQLLKQRVIEVYTGVVLAEAGVATLEKSVAAAEENRRLAADLFASGLAVEADVLQARLRLAELEEALVGARADLNVSRAALEILVGAPPAGEAWSLDPTLGEAETVAAPQTAETDFSRRPDLAAAAAREQAAARQVDLRRAERRPLVGAGAVVESAADTPFGHDGDHWSVGLSARFTLFDGGALKARLARAEAEAEAAKEARRALENGAALELRQARELRQAAARRLATSRAAAGFAERSLAIVRDRYREGLVSWVELLGSEAALTAAQSRELEARRSLVLAGARLALAAGAL